MEWSTPDDVRAQIQRLWDRGRILAARLCGEPLFPISVRMARPGVRELSERFAEARAWIRSLEEGSQAGYQVVYGEINHRQLGPNRVPQAVVVPSEDVALALIGKRRQSEMFDRLVQATKATRPELLPWMAKRPLEALACADDWERILAVVSWFCAHPHPRMYARQIDLPGVHTKLIETYRPLLAELLDVVLPAEAVDFAAVGVKAFDRRYGLREKPALLRFRVLDARLRLQGLDDVSTPAEQLAMLELPVRNVFITENEINGLAFPDAKESMVIFGLGYGLERLAAVPWLRHRAVFYWGDLDTHGFAILDKLRGVLPGVRSFLMDRGTLLSHRALWGEEPEPYGKALARLTADEAAVYDDLRFDRLGPHVRLEQERIAFGHLERAIATLLAGA